MAAILEECQLAGREIQWESKTKLSTVFNSFVAEKRFVAKKRDEDKSKKPLPLKAGEAVCSFLHLCFTANIEYPVGSSTLCTFLQRLVTILDENGTTATRTRKDQSAKDEKSSRWFLWSPVPPCTCTFIENYQLKNNVFQYNILKHNFFYLHVSYMCCQKSSILGSKSVKNCWETSILGSITIDKLRYRDQKR
jgi:hypothetical protein